MGITKPAIDGFTPYFFTLFKLIGSVAKEEHVPAANTAVGKKYSRMTFLIDCFANNLITIN